MIKRKVRELYCKEYHDGNPNDVHATSWTSQKNLALLGIDEVMAQDFSKLSWNWSQETQNGPARP